MDDEKWFVIAESICRREYEKRFNCDIDKGIGPVIMFDNMNDHINHMKEIINFWNELGCKYDKHFNMPEGTEKYNENWKHMDVLHRTLSTFCQWMQNMMELKTLQTYDEYVKNKN